MASRLIKSRQQQYNSCWRDVFYVRVVVCDGFSSSRIETQNMRGEKDLRVVVLGFVYFFAFKVKVSFLFVVRFWAYGLLLLWY